VSTLRDRDDAIAQIAAALKKNGAAVSGQTTSSAPIATA